MNDAELAAIGDANYWESFSMIARACGGKVLEREDTLGVCTGLHVPMLNQGFFKRPPRDAEGSLRELVEFFDNAGVPFIFRVREGIAPDAERTMESAGLPYTDTVPGMAMFPIGDAPPLPPGFSIEPVNHARSLTSFQEVAASGFGMPLPLAQGLFPKQALDIPAIESYLGFVDGQPVATSSLYFGDGTAGVYNVATLVHHRGRGYGAAMTWHAVSKGRERGCTVGILQASVMGRPVYERMGFRTVGPYRTFQRMAKESS